jgi:ubiquinone/menaquinone biosynthesis C-methylase UbiE
MYNQVQPIGEAYDLIAAHYDDLWSAHVATPQRRLTAELALTPGQRCADLGCGTGVDTLEMVRAVAPGEVVGVDVSQRMLDSALRRALAAGCSLTTQRQGAEEFIEQAADASFDAISLRFCLGYLNWRRALARLPRLLRPAGRVGILTILAGSAPQALGAYRNMAEELELPDVPLTALESLDSIERQLTAANTVVSASWLHRFRLTFASGEQLATWLRASGIATSPELAAAPAELLEWLWREFALRVEAFREGDVVPLDFVLAGVIAHKPDRRRAPVM